MVHIIFKETDYIPGHRGWSINSEVKYTQLFFYDNAINLKRSPTSGNNNIQSNLVARGNHKENCDISKSAWPQNCTVYQIWSN